MIKKDHSRLHYIIPVLCTLVVSLIAESSSFASPQLITHNVFNRIPSHYIVVLKSGATINDLHSVINRNLTGSTVKYHYRHVFSGFSARLTSADLRSLM